MALWYTYASCITIDMTEKYNRYCHFIFICKDKDCKQAGAKEVEKSLGFEVKKRGLQKITKIVTSKCTDRCKEAPVIVINNNWVGNVKAGNAETLIQQFVEE